eukprot:scaffold50993_cov61-Phaeocystis_antarctica.AAC.1
MFELPESRNLRNIQGTTSTKSTQQVLNQHNKFYINTTKVSLSHVHGQHVHEASRGDACIGGLHRGVPVDMFLRPLSAPKPSFHVCMRMRSWLSFSGICAGSSSRLSM